MDFKYKEKDIEESILIYLNTLKNTFAFKVQTTGYFDPKINRFRKQNSKFIIPGCSDILGIHQGRMLAVEVKTPVTFKQMMRRPTPTQQRQLQFLDLISDHGGIALVADSVEKVRLIFLDFLKIP